MGKHVVFIIFCLVSPTQQSCQNLSVSPIPHIDTNHYSVSNNFLKHSFESVQNSLNKINNPLLYNIPLTKRVSKAGFPKKYLANARGPNLNKQKNNYS